MSYIQAFFQSYYSNYSDISKTCWLRILIAFINTMSGCVSYFLSLYFFNEMYISVALTGLFISFYGIGTALGGILGGKLVDKISSDVVSIGSLFIKAIAFLILGYLKTPVMLMLNLFILGLTTYSFITANTVALLSLSGNNEVERLKIININYAASNLGLALAGIVIGFVADYGFHYVFYCASTFLFLSAIILIFQHAREIELVQPHINEEKSVNFKKNSWQLLGLVYASLFLTGLIIAQVGTTYSIYLHDTFPQLGNKSFGLLFALNAILIVLCQSPIVNWFKNHNKILVVGFGASLMGFGMLMLDFSFVFSLAVLACMIYTVGEMLFFSTAQLICYHYGGAKKKGQSLGLFQSIYALSIVVGPVFGGFIYQQVGGFILWQLCGLIGFTCFIACWLCRKQAYP